MQSDEARPAVVGDVGEKGLEASSELVSGGEDGTDAAKVTSTALIDNLLDRVGNLDPKLAEDLRRAVNNATSEREFGLVFNRHMPETVELPGRVVRKGDKVRIVGDKSETTWKVIRTRREDRHRVADMVRQEGGDEARELPLSELVVVADFRDSIYPGLKSTGKIKRGGDKPYHAVINSENYHALEALTFAYTGKVDCIYIDPPYNTGARDWKYNNDYVDGADEYKHSKWLSFMERRLKIAKKLLNPANSVLIVTIDEKEYLRLGMLLEQVFPAARIQMISSVISPGGVPRDREFTRVNEFIFFVMLGSSGPAKVPSDLLFTAWKTESENRSPIWRGLLRGGSGPLRSDSPSKFYPILVKPDEDRIVGADQHLPLGISRETYKPPEGLRAVWPLKSAGVEGRWELNRASFEHRLSQGFVRLGKWNSTSNQWGVNYLREAEIKRLESGELVVHGRAAGGHLEIDYAEGRTRMLYAKSVWNEPSHDAGTNGVSVVKALVPGRSFDYPKSLYAVEDTLRLFIGENPEALVLDFFSGSGTTAHAVMRLNKQDGGRRRAISITNNEVSADEHKSLRSMGRRPGDPEWESLGICEYITKPRIAAAITGKTPTGDKILGNYRFTDEFPMSEGFAESVEFFTLTYENPDAVKLDMAFSSIAPLLWLRAGGQGSRIDTPTDDFAVSDHYAVLFNPDRVKPFLTALRKINDLRCVFIVTDDDNLFQRVSAQISDCAGGRRVDVVRLYENYLTNFKNNAGLGL